LVRNRIEQELIRGAKFLPVVKPWSFGADYMKGRFSIFLLLATRRFELLLYLTALLWMFAVVIALLLDGSVAPELGILASIIIPVGIAAGLMIRRIRKQERRW
jgi:hypothetical protein